MLGIIGGSGLYGLIEGNERIMKNHYGETAVVLGKISGKRCAFIPRHGKKHEIPPHRINHRANIGALHELGVTDILAICSVGMISDYELGDLVVVRDFISFYGPAQTFFDDFSKGLKHTDMSEPYSNELIKKISEATQEAGVEPEAE